MCFLGALDAAQGRTGGYNIPDTQLTIEASETVVKNLGLKLNVAREELDFRYTIVNWNNEGERTGQEVIDAMRNTAVKLMENVNAV